MNDLTKLCYGKKIRSINLTSGIGYDEGCYGEIVFIDGSRININDKAEFVDKPNKERVYRVSYYTINGGRCKDFNGPDAESMANDFYNRHIKAHPEYQNREWSKTSITTFYR